MCFIQYDVFATMLKSDLLVTFNALVKIMHIGRSIVEGTFR